MYNYHAVVNYVFLNAPLYAQKEFDYEEGFEYHITVRVYEVPSGIMDIGKYQYKLHKSKQNLFFRL